MAANNSLAHTCAPANECNMKGLDFKDNADNHTVHGFHQTGKQPVWGDECIGNGITIRNLQRALRTAEALISDLEKRTIGYHEADFERNHLSDLTGALQRKLINEQSLLIQQNRTVDNLKAQMTRYTRCFKGVMTRILEMIEDTAARTGCSVDLDTDFKKSDADPEKWCTMMDKLVQAVQAQRDAVISKSDDLDGDLVMKTHDMSELEERCERYELRRQKDRMDMLESVTQLAERDAEIARLREALAALEKSLSDVRTDLSKAHEQTRSTVTQNLDYENTLVYTRREMEDLRVKLLQETRKVEALENTVRVDQATSTDSAVELVGKAIQTSPEKTFEYEPHTSRSSLKRPLSPMFGASSASQKLNVNAAESGTSANNEQKSNRSEALPVTTNASPTPHLDQLYVGSQANTPKAPEAKVTRATRRKAISAATASTSIEDPVSSALTSPVTEPEERKRSKRTKTAK